MYRRYENAGICCAYLYDVNNPKGTGPEFAKSQWFTRGWTLQELVAPREVIFFGGKGVWFEIGTRTKLRDSISQITKIGTRVLEYNQDVFKASIAQKDVMGFRKGDNETGRQLIAFLGFSRSTCLSYTGRPRMHSRGFSWSYSMYEYRGIK
jgi:hypothetical protein